MFSDPMEVAQGTADEPTSGESLGAYIALAILFLIHMICWIVSIVKAIKDRKAIKIRLKDSNAKQKLLPTDSEHLESEKDNSEVPGVKFALTHADENGSATPAAAAAAAANGRRPSRAEPIKHHFARSQQRVLSAGNARRVTAEELAIMLDSYSVPPVTDATRPPPSPRPIPSPTVEIEVEHAGPQALLA